MVLSTSLPVCAVALGVFATQERAICPLWWTLPTLLFYALFPHTPLLWVGLFPVLFWSEFQKNQGALFPALSVILSVAMMWHAANVISPVLCACILVGFVFFVLGKNLLQRTPPKDFGVIRPLFLIILMIAAEHEGIISSARGAIEALLLDLVLLIISVPAMNRFQGLLILRYPFPPLPGFIVLWLGIHSALGLAVGASEWSVLGVLSALIFGLFSILDIAKLGFRQSQVVSRQKPLLEVLAVGSATVLLPMVVWGVCSPVIHFIGGAWVWPFWSLEAGDGSYLKIPALILVLFVVWLFLVKTWRYEKGLEKALISFLPTLNKFQYYDVIFEKIPNFPWLIRRLIVENRKRLSALSLLWKGELPDMRRMAVGIWLFLLAIVLAVLGFAS
ncbi:hypothetical protein [Swingsia samuiensis]|uniref:hypothetical protein n=1 Tax=Swingsia samuiensis TaxID=1293412 RepID=UPI001FEBD167|nr:hypothetical protein [Swingsia samuiensis]